MANETIGRVTCPMCGGDGQVRRYKTGRRLLYYVCGCGIIRPNTQKGQDWLLENAEIWGAEGPVNVEPQKQEQPKAEPVNVTEQTEPTEQRRGGFFSFDW